MKQEYADVEVPGVLPKPQTEFEGPVANTASAPVINEKELSQIVEKIHKKGQAVNSPSPTNSSQSVPVTSQADDTVNNSHTMQVGATSLIADDVDLIEKEWVEKAKSIVNSTKNDPYVQNNELNKVKAEYLKARFNKEVKIAQG